MRVRAKMRAGRTGHSGLPEFQSGEDEIQFDNFSAHLPAADYWSAARKPRCRFGSVQRIALHDQPSDSVG